MKYALYFFGGCLLVLSFVLWSVVTMALGAVSDAKELIAQAPIVIEKTREAVDEVKQAGAELEAKVAAARDSVASMKVMGTDKARDVGNAFGEVGRSALKRVLGEDTAEASDAIEQASWMDAAIFTDKVADEAIVKALYANAKLKEEEWPLAYSSKSVRFASIAHEGVTFVRNKDDSEWTLALDFGTNKARDLGKFPVPGDVDIEALITKAN